jgi:ATP-binding cassette subfamily B protein
LKPNKGLLINIFFAPLIVTILGIIGAFYFSALTDYILPGNLTKTLYVFSIGIIILDVFKILLGAFRTQLLLYLSQNINIPLMLGYYNHVIKLPMNFFGTRETGEIISRFNDASKIRDAVSGSTLTMMIDSLMVIVGGITLYTQNHLLFGITIVPVVLYAIIVWVFNKPLNRINRETMENNAKLTSYLVESLNGIETVKAFNGETKVCFETEKRFIKLTKSAFKNGWINNLEENIKGAVKSIFGTVVLWCGAYEVLK